MPHEFNDDTLNDIKARDILNLEVFLKKKIRRYKKFEDETEALAFMGGRVSQIVATLGVSIERAREDKEYDIDKALEVQGVKIENRVYDEKNDPGNEWRSGVYIYKANEIAGFVGYPLYDPDDFKGYNVMYTQKL